MMLQSEETVHQQLQRSLSQRSGGGPFEHIRSLPARLRNTRSCDIMHSSMEEPLSPYKSLESLRPRWQSTHHKFHLTDGMWVADQDTIVLSARDKLTKTKHGLVRTSSGTVTFSNTHREKAELDVQLLADIISEGVPGGGHNWTPKKLEHVFQMRSGRPGVWAHYEVPFVAFLHLFPRTFEMFGNNGYVRDRARRTRGTKILDNMEDAVARLARARESGAVEKFAQPDGGKSHKSEDLALPELKQHRFKAAFRSFEVKHGDAGHDTTNSRWTTAECATGRKESTRMQRSGRTSPVATA